MTNLNQLLTAACQHLFAVEVESVLTIPEEQFGDYASNLALQLAGRLKQPPLQIAQQLKDYLDSQNNSAIANIEVIKPGFLNIFMSHQALWQAAQDQPNQPLKGQRILLEYSCPNPFKELHVGHLYNTIAGDSLSVLLARSGATVYRANFGGDVGLHVAKCLWGLVKTLGGEEPHKMSQVAQDQRANFLSTAYVAGAQAFEDDSAATQQIKKYNAAIYEFHNQDDHQSPLAQIYWLGRDWSYAYFKDFYKQLAVNPFDKFYPESAAAPRGLATVQAHRGSVFEDSNGAVVFKGQAVGLHTRVFITSAGLPTYEAKDLGVILTEVDDFAYDRRIIITGNDQVEYMRVVFAALQQIDSKLAAKQTHLTNGTVRFGDGRKMSSRLGNVLSANQVLQTVNQAVEAPTPALRRDIMLAAVKYAFLKQRLGGDIAFDVAESVSLQGNSGPYIQYAHARARSILSKSTTKPLTKPVFEAGERSLVRQLGQFSPTVQQAVQELAPHLLCTYLYELCQTFNRFYEHHRVLDDPRQALRLQLVQCYADTLRSGLELLNIPAPNHI